MGAVILRAQTCITCGGPMPSAARVDRRYCKAACRTLAYRVRRRVNATRPPGPLEPEWTEPNAVVKTMLTSLAQIQARVLDFAHQLEQEELYARLPVRTKPQRSGTTDSPHSDSAEQLALLAQLDDQMIDQEEDADASAPDQARQNFSHRKGAADADGGSESTAKLDEVLRQRDQLRADLRTEQARTQQLDSQLKTLQKQSSDASATAAATVDGARLGARLDEVRQQREQLEADLLAERERTGRLDAQLKTVQKEAKEALGRLRYKQAVLQQEKDTLASQISDLGTQLYRANEALATWERAGAESLTIADRNSSLQQENATLRAEVKRLQPPSANADALVRVMIDRVKSLHWLAIYQIQREWK